MRLQERYKQTIYVANETEYGSQEYDEPYKLRCIVSPKSDSALQTAGIVDRQHNVELKFESRTKGLEKITQNSKVWIKKKPNPNAGATDFTHSVTSRDITTHDWFIVIECKGATGDFPLL